jgi:hypothetical protein
VSPRVDPKPAQIDREQLRCIVEDLVELHREGVRLAKRLLLVQETVDRLERLADLAIDCAAASAPDAEAVERAVSVAAAAQRANDDEFDAATQWALHLEHSIEVTRSASEIVKQL